MPISNAIVATMIAVIFTQRGVLGGDAWSGRLCVCAMKNLLSMPRCVSCSP
jgi:hypothetical protein